MKGATEFKLGSSVDDKIETTVRAYVVTKLLPNMPHNRLELEKWDHIQRPQLADETFHLPGEMDLLLGAAFYTRIISDGILKYEGAPTALNTTFGWIVLGEAGSVSYPIRVSAAAIGNDDLMNQLIKFWELEHMPVRKHPSAEEQRCETIFTSTTTRDGEGRYIARMPLVPDPPKVTDTRHLALARLYQMEKRFARDPVLKENYQKFMNEYESLDHMVPLPPEKWCDNNAIYIPHHAAGVHKFRVVFDGSCKNKDGISVNDIQLNGGKLQPELTSTIMRFRTHKIALCADIAKMYRQVRMAEDQRDHQRILWRAETTEPIQEYQLATQTYGMKSAGAVCIRTLIQCAKDYESEHPKAAKAVYDSFYVDDYMGGGEDVYSAMELYHELNTMLAKGKFEFAKWATNNPDVHRQISETENKVIELDKEENNAVLGLNWSTRKDVFQFKIKNPPKENEPTKRSIVGDIARLYDPNGYLAPIVVYAKIIIQGLWRTKFGWDDIVTDSTA